MDKSPKAKSRGHSFWIADDVFEEFASACAKNGLTSYSPIVESLLVFFVDKLKEDGKNEPAQSNHS